jgi:hypothetical protein
LLPVDTVVAVEMVNTVIGEELFAMAPLPSWPKAFEPQHFTGPSASLTHVSEPPAEICDAVLIPETFTGDRLLFVLPFPS